MVGLVNVSLQSESRGSIQKNAGSRSVSRSSEGYSSKIDDLSSGLEITDGSVISDRQSVVDNSHSTLPKVLAKTSAPEAQQAMIDNDNYKYDLSFPKVELAELDEGQQKIFREAQKIVMQIVAENGLSILQVLNDLSFVSLKRDPVAVSQHVLKLNALHQKASEILMQRGEKSISLSDAFWAYKDCVEQLRNNGYRDFTYNNRNLVMIPMDIQVFLKKGEPTFHFDFSGCCLTEIPDCFQNCPILNHVQLSDTMISTLPPSLLMNPSLSRLYLRNTAIDTVPAGLDALPLIRIENDSEVNALRLIDFTGNGIVWKTLSDGEKKIIKKLIDLRTEVHGIELPKRLRFKSKMKGRSVNKSSKKHVKV